MSTVRALAAAHLLALVTALAACSGNGGDAQRDPDQPEEEAAAVESDAEFVELAELRGPARVTYRSGAADEAAGEGTITWAQDGDRWSMSLDRNGDSWSKTINDGQRQIACLAHGDDWRCTAATLTDESLPPAMGALGQILSGEAIADWEGWERVGEEDIIGRPALCGQIHESLETADGEIEGRHEVCLDRETGAVLRTISEGIGEPIQLEAEELGSPSEEDFEAPAEPQQTDA